MHYITGTDRTQAVLFAQSLDEVIDQDNEVRLIDLFVESLDLSTFNFQLKGASEGRPPYHPKDLLKLYVYGYLNSIRSSRGLERECTRNVELMWLLHQLVPDHNTISNFRRDNEKAIRKVFRHTVSIARHFELIGGRLLAGDSTKLRAQNSKKNNFSERKINQHLQYIEQKLQQYNEALQQADEEGKKEIAQQLDKQNKRKEKYYGLQEQLTQSGQTQVSTSDPDSRLMTLRTTSEVAYSVQTTVDAEHCLTLDYKVTNETDNKAMGVMLRRAKIIVGHPNFTALYDKGYHSGGELKKGMDMGIELLVGVPHTGSRPPHPRYGAEHFSYDAKTDSYTCPEGKTLYTNGSKYIKSGERSPSYIKQYKTTACTSCPVRALCTKNERGRRLERSEYHAYVERNKENLERAPATYKRRQAIIEHTYGILKRQWGFGFILTKRGLKRASADVGLMFTALNLRRLLNLIDKDRLKVFLRAQALTIVVEKTVSKLFLASWRVHFIPVPLCLAQNKAAA